MARFIEPEKKILKKILTAHIIEVENRMKSALKNFEEDQTQASKNELLEIVPEARYAYNMLHKLVCDEMDSSPQFEETHWKKKKEKLRTLRQNWIRRQTIDGTETVKS